MGRKPKKRWEDMTELERLREENERLRTSKKVEGASPQGRCRTACTAATIRGVVQAGYRLDILLSITRLARSTYYYHVKQRQSPPKDLALQEEIQTIFTEHQGNYVTDTITLIIRKSNDS